MIYSKQRLKEVTALKKQAVRLIQHDIGQIHVSPSRKYIQEFNREFQTFENVCNSRDIVEAAQGANLIWIGDYHALGQTQAYAADFIRQLAGNKNNLIVAVEPVFARNQEILDRWMNGIISEREFLDAVNYDEEWGCDWKGYQNIFATARELRIPVYGADCHPRNDMRSIGRRDLGVARRIGHLMEKNPGRTLVVIFGESHLAANHLPGRVRTILEKKGIESTDLLIVQNIDALYWKLQESGQGEASAVQVRDGCYCVFNATPIEKYESFRQYLHKCIEEDSYGDWTVPAQILMDIMMNFLAVKQNGSVVNLMPLPELDAASAGQFQLAGVTEEFARLMYQACRGELDKRIQRAAHDEFFVKVIEHGLGYFCSKLLDSSRDGIESLAERVLSQIGRNDNLTGAIELLIDPGKQPGARHFAALRSAIEIKAGKQKTRRMLAQLLGYALGRRLYIAYMQSRISRKDIHALFHDPLNTPLRPLECYRELHQL